MNQDQDGEWKSSSEALGTEVPVEPVLPPENKIEFVDSFPDMWKTDFEGLAYLGYLEDTVRIPFHDFKIRTILPAEKIEISIICRELQGAIGYASAYKAACVAAALISADGRPIQPAEKKRNAVQQKYEYVVNTWYDPIIDILYNAIDKLALRQIELLRILGVLPSLEETSEVDRGKAQETDGEKTLM